MREGGIFVRERVFSLCVGVRERREGNCGCEREVKRDRKVRVCVCVNGRRKILFA